MRRVVTLGTKVLFSLIHVSVILLPKNCVSVQGALATYISLAAPHRAKMAISHLTGVESAPFFVHI
jgi:hypothetical protein